MTSVCKCFLPLFHEIHLLPSRLSLANVPPHIITSRINLRLNSSLILRPTRPIKVPRLVIPTSQYLDRHLQERVYGIETHCPVAGFSPPPSLSGISLLSPWPEAAEPYTTSEPGNFCSTDWSTPDSYITSAQIHQLNALHRKAQVGE